MAEQDGRLHPWYRLMSVNDTELDHSSLSFAVQTLKGAPKGESYNNKDARLLEEPLISLKNKRELRNARLA